MRYKEVYSIKEAKEKINSLRERIKRTKQLILTIQTLEPEGDFKKHFISGRNRRIGQLNRQIKHYLADIKNMKKINKSLTEDIY